MVLLESSTYTIMKNINHYAILLLLFVIADNSLAKKIFPGEISGKLAVGGAYEFQGTNPEGHNPNNSYYQIVYSDEVVIIGKAELTFDIKAGNAFTGRFEFEGDHRLAGIRINDCWVRYKFNKATRLTIGNQRKIFGLEEFRGSKKRITNNRSFLNRYIRSFMVLEHDPIFNFRIKQKLNQHSLKYFTAIGADGDVRVFSNLAVWWEWPQGSLGFCNLYTWHWNISQSNRSNSNLSSLSLEYILPQWFGAMEIFWGLDPNATNQYQQLNTPQKIYFSAIKILATHTFFLANDIIPRLEPVFSGSYLANNVTRPSQGYSELLGGVIIHFNTKLPVCWNTDLTAIYAHNFAGVKLGRYTWKIVSKIQMIW